MNLTEKKEFIAELIDIDGVPKNEIADSLQIPSDNTLGDVTLPCFKFSKALRKSPIIIANDLANTISVKKPLAKAEAVNGYLNFFFDKDYLIDELFKKTKGDIMSKNIGGGRTVCLDFSSINIAKPFHIGHLSTTVIGGALYRIYKKLGFNAVAINHLGDYGTQFGKLIVAFKKWGSIEELQNRGMKYLTEIYVRYHQESEKDPTLDDKARYYFKKIEDDDEECTKLFNLFKEITLNEVDKVYKRLKIEFDSYNGEAFYKDKMQPILDELEEKNLITVSDGAKIVDLDEFGMPPCLLVKADGATLYPTRDLAAAFYRKNTYDFYKCLYIVAYQQNLHFQQIFKVIELMGKDWASGLVHVPFGMVSLEDGTMSTRKGKVILLEDVLNKAVEKSLQIITEKNSDLENKEAVAEKIGVGAVIFFVLSNNRIKDIVFKYDKVLNFDGETAPYIQYTNARCNSILKKANVDLSAIDMNNLNYEGIKNKEGDLLISLLDRYQTVLEDVLEKYEPSLLSRHIIDICQAFNKFYIENRIIDAPEEIKYSRLLLVNATHKIIEDGLALLGIDAPEAM